MDSINEINGAFRENQGVQNRRISITNHHIIELIQNLEAIN